MSVVSGYLVEHFSWRWMFIIEGLPAVIWAFIWWRLVDDRPRQAAWLSGSENATWKTPWPPSSRASSQ